MRIYEHKAQYYETDQMGIIHHSNYIRWMEEARMDYLSSMGYPMEVIEKEGIVSPVVSVNCQYKKVCTLNEIICIEVHVKHYNGVKLEIEYIMTEKESGEIRTIGQSTHCFTDKAGRIVSVKKVYAGLHEALEKSKEEA